MAFPSIRSSNSGVDAVDVQTFTVVLPATISAGDLLIVIFAIDSSPAVTWPGGWTQVWDEADGTATRWVCYAKLAVGNEDGTTINPDIGAAGAQQASYVTYAIQDVFGTDVASSLYNGGFVDGGQTTAPDSGALDPGIGAADFLWISTYHTRDGGSDATVYPTNYSLGNLSAATQTGANGTSTGIAARQLNASSEDPGAFTTDLSASWLARTLAARPAAGGATHTLKMMLANHGG